MTSLTGVLLFAGCFKDFAFLLPTSNFQLPSKKAFSFFTLPTTINKQPEL